MNQERHYDSPVTLAQALEAMKLPGAMALAGGQSLIPTMAAKGVRSGRLVNLLNVPELQVLSIEDHQVRVGAATMLSRLLEPAFLNELPGLAAAVDCIGNHVIRNHATFGGCLAWADPCGEIPMILQAYEATVVTDRREIPAAVFVTGANQNCLADGELVVEVLIPRGRAVSFEEQMARKSAGRAVLSVACAAVPGENEFRFVVGGLVDRPVQSGPIANTSTESVLVELGAFLDSVVAQYPAHRDSTSQEYRRRIAVPLMKRCLQRMEVQ